MALQWSKRPLTTSNNSSGRIILDDETLKLEDKVHAA